MRVTNIWHILNLRESPFFQDPLDPVTGAHYPIDLFVGRQREAEHILRGLGSAPHSRHAIQGEPGVGKTTLVQYIKARVAEDGWLSEADPIAVTSAATADELLLRILAFVHDTLAARDETLLNLKPMQDVRHLLDLERARSLNLSVSLPTLGGAGVGAGPQRFTGPGALTVQPVRLLRDLSDIASRHLQAPGILIHLNNLKNIAEPDQERAARVVRDLRDNGLMYPGFHFLLVGTNEAIRTIVAGQEQLRSVFSNPGPLAPLAAGEFHRLLEMRYDHLRLSPDRPWSRPVTERAADAIYELFRGNLRGTLHALDEAAKVLIGRGEEPAAPMDLDRMGPVLHALYQSKLRADLTSGQIEQLRRIAEPGLDALVTQAETAKRLGLSSAATSVLFSEIQRKGYLVEMDPATTGKPGRPRQQYALTGPARLAFGTLRP